MVAIETKIESNPIDEKVRNDLMRLSLKQPGEEMKKTLMRARGFTLIEILLVIGFISGAMVLAFVTYPKVQATNRANVEAQHIITISGGIKNLYSTARNFSSLNNMTLIKAGVIPDDMQVTGSTVSNVWSGTVSVQGDSSASNLRYKIVYTDVPSSECNKLATGVSTNFLQVHVNSTTVRDVSSATTQKDIDPAEVAAECAASSGVNTLTFTAR